MKKLIWALFFCLPFVSYSQNINIVYAVRTYYSPEGNYAEINTSVDGSSIRNIQDNDGYYSKKVELVTIVCPVAVPDSVVYIDKRVIQSPKVEDSLLLGNVSLMDMQRIPLSNGNYVVYFETRDLACSLQPMKYRDAIVMDYDSENIAVSDIMIIDKLAKTSQNNIYTKSGYDLQPYIFDVIDKNTNVLQYYTEIYNADKEFKSGNMYAIVTCLEDIQTNKKTQDVQKIKRQRAESVTPYIGSLDISSLYEGSYYLTVEVRNEKNILYAYKRYPFIKLSDKKRLQDTSAVPQDAFVNLIPSEELDENIKCLRPIADEYELNFILNNGKEISDLQKRYILYRVYLTRNNINPEQEWKNYTAQVKAVNDKYSTHIKKGYDTDMGRVILMYGAPNTVIDEKFSASSGLDIRSEIDRQTNYDAPHMDPKGVNYYPYQIWVYDRTPFGESNRKFIFYAKQDNLAEYFLLHSDARGELQDLYWENTLSHGTLERGVVGKAGKQFRRGHE